MDIQSLSEAINLILITFFEPFSWAVILGVSFTIAMSYGGGWTFKTTLLVRDLGLPVGLIFSMLGTASILDQSHNLLDLSALYAATAIMLMTITYGGLLAIVAHFILLSDKDGKLKSRSGTQSNQTKDHLRGSFHNVVYQLRYLPHCSPNHLCNTCAFAPHYADYSY